MVALCQTTIAGQLTCVNICPCQEGWCDLLLVSMPQQMMSDKLLNIIQIDVISDVIHTVGPKSENPKMLARCYTACLELADLYDITTLVRIAMFTTLMLNTLLLPFCMCSIPCYSDVYKYVTFHLLVDEPVHKQALLVNILNCVSM